MKKVIIIALFLLLSCFYSNAFAVAFSVDAELNSITPNWYLPVPPLYPWPGPVDTGLFFNSGDLLEITASGLWGNAYWLSFGPDGNPNENIAPTYPGAGYPVAALMGKIGNGSYFFVGSNYSSTVTNSGILYLGFNDTDYGNDETNYNNWGTVNADVKFNPVPEPSSMLLLGFGLLGFAAKSKKLRYP